MTIQRLVHLIAEAAGEDGVVRRGRVKDDYGAGFEGALMHAQREQIVIVHPSENGIELTDAGRRMLRFTSDT